MDSHLLKKNWSQQCISPCRHLQVVLGRTGQINLILVNIRITILEPPGTQIPQGAITEPEKTQTLKIEITINYTHARMYKMVQAPLCSHLRVSGVLVLSLLVSPSGVALVLVSLPSSLPSGF